MGVLVALAPAMRAPLSAFLTQSGQPSAPGVLASFDAIVRAWNGLSMISAGTGCGLGDWDSSATGSRRSRRNSQLSAKDKASTLP